ncbi:hypothetical protein E8E11_006239 [Didymella keratinophila]|nr:hypothetical protein E8E11_006239 [Didymella keratinophila]
MSRNVVGSFLDRRRRQHPSDTQALRERLVERYPYLAPYILPQLAENYSYLEGLCVRCRAVDISPPTASPDRLLLTLSADAQSATCAFCSQFQHVFDQNQNERLELHYHSNPTDDINTRKGDNGAYFTLRALANPYEVYFLSHSSSELDPVAQRIALFDLELWLSKCDTSHGPICQPRTRKRTMVLKAIDCTSRSIVSVPLDARYVCLSYVWGTGCEERPVLDLDQGAIPATVEDAIFVTTELNVQYLWIDRYCIDQTNDEEKHHNISNMDVIYRGAYCTIIAAAGCGPDVGLPGIRNNSRPRPGFKFLAERSGVRTSGFQNPRVEIQNSIWSTRGWTYQEMLLSPRRLVFTPSQVYFQCGQGHRIEAAQWLGDSTDNMSTLAIREAIEGLPRLTTAYTDTYIHTRLEEYYTRQFSFNADLVKAFVGILQAFSLEDWTASSHVRHLRAAHVQGLPLFYFEEEMTDHPRRTFLTSLTWQLSGNDNWSVLSQKTSIFPSWTWASVKASRDTQDCGRLTFPRRRVNVWSKLQDDILVHCYDRIRQTELAQYTTFLGETALFQPWIDITSWVAGSFLQPSLDVKDSCELAGVQNGKLVLDYPREQKRTNIVLVLLGAYADGHKEEVVFLVVERRNPSGYRRLGLFSCTMKLRSSLEDVVAAITPGYTVSRTRVEDDAFVGFQTSDLRVTAPKVWQRQTVRLI